ncbi:MAG: PTS sugar transporter subunit IIA [Candidatus Omnitrophica bacterium]|nr:PTS sugar transporter subunit IIA [Candidatus Omnitrophota bacterium]
MVNALLREENIFAGLDASDYKEALEKLVGFLPDWALTSGERKKIFQRLLMREQLGTTAVGGGTAFPHCFSTEVSEPLVAFGVSSDGIDYPSLDGRAVHFIFVLILPQTESAELQKRQILQSIKWFLCDRYLQERLRGAKSASEIFHLLVPDAQRHVALGV